MSAVPPKQSSRTVSPKLLPAERPEGSPPSRAYLRRKTAHRHTAASENEESDSCVFSGPSSSDESDETNLQPRNSRNSRAALCNPEVEDIVDTRRDPEIVGPRSKESSATTSNRHDASQSARTVRGRGPVGRGMYADTSDILNDENRAGATAQRRVSTRKSANREIPVEEHESSFSRGDNVHRQLHDPKRDRRSVKTLPERKGILQLHGEPNREGYHGQDARQLPPFVDDDTDKAKAAKIMTRSPREPVQNVPPTTLAQQSRSTHIKGMRPDRSSGAVESEVGGEKDMDIAQLKQIYKIICMTEEKMASEKKSRIASRSDYEPARIQSHIAERLILSRHYTNIMKCNYALSRKYDLETRLWRNAIYPCIETLRANVQVDGGHLQERARIIWTEFIHDAQALYSEVIDAMKAQWTLFLPGSAATVPVWHRAVNYLADLSRYSILYLHGVSPDRVFDADWALPKRLYKQASLLAPQIGLYPNQLAMVAMYKEEYLNALHYYLRSLTVRGSFVNARDSLVFLFQANRKRLERLGSRALNLKNPASQSSQAQSRSTYAKLHSLFISLHEMIFTKISTERFSDVFAAFVGEVKTYLTGLRESDQEIAKMWFELGTINVSMSLVGKFSAQEGKNGATDSLKEHLVAVCLHLAEVAVDQQMGNLRDSFDEDTTHKSDIRVTGGIVYLIVILLWLAGASTQWVSYISAQKYTRFWSSFANLCNSLKTTLHENMSCSLTSHELFGTVLPEDWELRGSLVVEEVFRRHQSLGTVMAADAAKIDNLIHSHVDQSVNPRFDLDSEALAKQRARRVLLLARFIADKSVPVLHYDEKVERFVCQKAGTVSMMPEVEEAISPSSEDKDEEEMEYEPYDFEGQSSDDALVDVGDDDETVHQLMARRKELHGNLHSRQRVLATQSMDSKKPSSKVKLVPGKTVLVFDTNIFLRNLEEIIALVESGSWVVSVPLVVITELDGLKSSDDKRGEDALRALHYLESEFGSGSQGDGPRRKSWLKLQTSRGNFLQDLTVRTEQWTEANTADERRKNNDDAILKCCLFYTETRKHHDAIPVVLVTADVNMKLKARTMGIDVVDQVPMSTKAYGRKSGRK